MIAFTLIKIHFRKLKNHLNKYLHRQVSMYFSIYIVSGLCVGRRIYQMKNELVFRRHTHFKTYLKLFSYTP